MIVVLCDICRCELSPRTDGYKWFSNGGVITIIDQRPARLIYQGREIKDCCSWCIEKCYARVWTNCKGDVL